MRAKLEECQIKSDALSGEITEKAADLENAKLDRLGVARKVDVLQVVICILCSKRESALETFRLIEGLLDEQIGELEKEASGLSDRVVALEAVKA